MLAGLVLLAGTACEYASNAGPPVTVCGRVLMESAAMPVVQDVSSGPATIDRASEVKAGDGKLAAIVLHPNTPTFEIRVGRPRGATDTLDVRL